jgi:hypothetical protein
MLTFVSYSARNNVLCISERLKDFIGTEIRDVYVFEKAIAP